MTDFILDGKNTILLERPRLPAANADYEPVEGMLSVMYITALVGGLAFYVYVLGR